MIDKGEEEVTTEVFGGRHLDIDVHFDDDDDDDGDDHDDHDDDDDDDDHDDDHCDDDDDHDDEPQGRPLKYILAFHEKYLEEAVEELLEAREVNILEDKNA